MEELLYTQGYGFDFFQAVRVLERLMRDRQPIGRGGPPAAEIARFRAHLSLSFPPSSIYDVEKPSSKLVMPSVTVSFLGLTGPSGVLPRHYTEMLLRLEREAKGPERRCLRDWFDLFNHRLISLFYRAWEKYRFYVPYDRGEYALTEPDAFTRSLFSLVGLGQPTLRNRLRVAKWEQNEEDLPVARPLAKLDDLVFLYYGGFFAQRPRNALSLEALLCDYFQLQVRVKQFHGQWLTLDRENQSSLAPDSGTNQLGVSMVAGERVWDVQGKIRLRMGPLRYAQFIEFIPDHSPVGVRKTFFLLSHLVRMYVGAEMDFDVQLILKAEDVPWCQLAAGADGGPRLGWNTWMCSQPMTRDAEDAIFEGEELVFVNPEARPMEWSGAA